MRVMPRRASTSLWYTTLCALMTVATVSVAHAQFVYDELHGFVSGPLNPQTQVVDGGDGYLYGATSSGGRYQSGTIYRIDKATNALTVLYDFNQSGSSPAYPGYGLIDGGDGFLYGTSSYGGNGYGTIFKFEKATATVSTLYALNYNDGYYPQHGVTLGGDGYLYGAANYGGINGNGTLYRVDPSTGAFNVLHSFTSSAPAPYSPWSRPVDGGDGFLYGTTYYGGALGAGTVYKFAKVSGALSVVYSFPTAPAPATGYYQNPNGVADPGNGFLYGTTYYGGTSGYYGSVYKVAKSTGAYTLLHSFTTGATGYNPQAPMTVGGDGFVYGTSQYGGTTGGGVLFKVDTATNAFTTVHAFQSSTEGYYHNAGVSVSGNMLYGAAQYGGPAERGTVYGVNKNTGVTTVFRSFGEEPRSPYAHVVDAGNGYLYGTTLEGGQAGYGTIFKVNKTTGATTFVHSFSVNSTGYYPYAGLTDGGDGFLYGTAAYGGVNGAGTVFKINKTTDAVSAVHSFPYNEGYDHDSGVILGSDGFLYGTAQSGGVNGYGSVYRVNKTTGATTVFHSFSYISGGAYYPTGVIDGGNGFLYGTTQQGGTSGCGTVYKINLTGAPTLTPLHSFDCSTGGYYPQSGLIDGGNGFFYGTTLYGGAIGNGTVYRVDKTTEAVSLVHSFNYNEGYYPSAKPLLARDGLLYGTTQYGGAYGNGTVYVLDKTTGSFGLYFSFNRLAGDGYYPQAPLTQGVSPDDRFYGTTTQGGSNGGGAIYTFDSGVGNQTITVTSAPPASANYLNSFFVAATGGGSGNPVVIAASDACSGGGNNSASITMNSGTGTCTVTFNQAGAPNYNAAPTVTRSTTAAKQFASLFVSNASYGYDGTPKSLTATTSPAGLAVDFTYTGTSVTYGPTSTPPSGAGSYSVVATINDSNYQGTANRFLTITKANASVSLSDLTQTYTGAPLSPTVTTVPAGLAFSFSGAPRTNVGTYGVTATVNDANYQGSANGTFVIGKATATVTLGNLTQTYTGSGLLPTATTNPAGLAVVWTGAPQTNVGTYGVTATVNDANYQGSASGTFVIGKATATVTLSNLTQTYTGGSLMPTATTAPSGLAITWSGAPQTAAGSYPVTATVNNANYQGSASGTFVIQKASATVTLSNLTRTYTGGALTPTATTSPSGLTIVWANAPQTDAGSYSVTATVDNPNYQGSANGTFVIGKAAATVTLSDLTRTYTGSPLSPSATTTPSGLPITWSGAPQTGAGSHPVTATVDHPNYQGSASGTFVIEKATATVTLSNLAQTYTGSALSPAAATSPSGLAIVWTGAPQTVAGSYPVTATVNDPNYQGAASNIFVIQKASATVALANLTQTYTGSPLSPAASTTPAGLTIVWTGAPQTPAGSYPVTATVDDPNYEGAASGTFVIQKAAAAVVLADMTQTYTGSSLAPTATTSPSGLALAWSGTPQTAAGSYPVTATVNDPNYVGAASGTFVIGKASATVTLGNLTQTYTGSSLMPTASTSPVGLTIVWTGTPQTNAGSHPVTATVNDPNYQGAASGTFVIQKATATVTLNHLTQTYTGGSLTPTAATSPSGLGIVWTGAPKTGAGSYPVTATVNDPNYAGAASGTFVIEKASAVVTLSNLTQTYTGSALSPAASTTPSGLTIAWTGAPQTGAGSYPVTATVNDPNHEGAASGTFVIQKASAAVVLSNLMKTYTGSPLMPAAATTPAGLAVVWTGAPETTAGSHAVTATVNNPNYQGSATGTFVIAKATPVVTWAAPTPITYGTPLGAAQLNASANVAGSFAYTPDAGTVLNGGLQTLSAMFTPADVVNYNAATVSTQISVSHSWSNVLQPIDVDNSSIFKLGSTLPVKFQLTGGSAGVTDLDALIFLAKISNSVTGDELEPVSTSAPDAGNTFRYTSGQYIFNLNTKTLSQGTWQIRIDLRDGVTRTVLVSLRK